MNEIKRRWINDVEGRVETILNKGYRICRDADGQMIRRPAGPGYQSILVQKLVEIEPSTDLDKTYSSRQENKKNVMARILEPYLKHSPEGVLWEVSFIRSSWNHFKKAVGIDTVNRKIMFDVFEWRFRLRYRKNIKPRIIFGVYRSKDWLQFIEKHKEKLNEPAQ